ncbi:secreted acidic protein 1A-like [Neltuma alba]|uniref:secreted acidic protein 1A-like n=1 Tax=Neltuma alba TaxID=207710 RepID=UPI0010A3364A|nr:secreted acidic protein 1A-like [Prosopis alba]
MDVLEESHKRLSNQFAKELTKVQLHLQGMRSSNLKNPVDNTSNEAVILPSDGKGNEQGSDKGDSDGDTIEDEAHDQKGGSDEGDDDGEEGDSEKGDANGDKVDDNSNDDDGGDEMIDRSPTNVV